jgi:hypothetical protein
MIADRQRVADQIKQLARRLDELSGWTATPDGPFPADAVELGEFMGQVAVLLLAGGHAPGDGPDGTGGGARCRR